MSEEIKPIALSKGAKKAFSYILHNQSVTRASICTALGIGAVTAGKYTQELLDCGMIKEDGFMDSSGGRKPIAYSVNNTGRYILCINISTIYCEVAVSDFNLHLQSIRHFRILPDDKPDAVVAKIWAVYPSIKEELCIEDSSFIGAGVILYGAIKNQHGVMYRPIVQYMNEGWIDYPILDRLSSFLPMPVYAEKGITATASLEYNYGIGRRCRSLLYILCAMNIRSAFVLDGKVQGSSPFYEDAFGHMVINYDGLACRCGQYGCINCYASIPAVLDTYRKGVKLGGHTIIAADPDNVTIEEVCKAACGNDECASNAIVKAARMLGVALANYANVTSPEIVLIAGLLPELSDLYYETAMNTARERLRKTDNDNAVFYKVGSFPSPLTTSGASLVLDCFFGA